jgi:hypothetical protein
MRGRGPRIHVFAEGVDGRTSGLPEVRTLM